MRRKGWLFFAYALGALLVAGGGVAALRLPRLLAERRLAQVRADWRALSIACATYGLDNCGLNFPADTSLRRQHVPATPQTFESDTQYLRGPGSRGPCLLTTPVSYMKEIPRDPFRSDGGFYSYASIKGSDRPGSISPLAFLHSPGPDGRTDLDPARLREEMVKIKQGSTSWWQLSTVERVAIRKVIDPVLYDPSNGTRSGGDLILIMDGHSIHYGFSWAANSPEWTGEMNTLLGAGKAEQLTLPLEQRRDDKLILETQREIKVAVPDSLYKTWCNAGLIASGGGQGGTIDLSRLDQLRGHLGPFIDFFNSPRPLTAAEKESLDKWRREDPKWWDALEKTKGYVSHAGPVMSVFDVYPLLVLDSKSRLLLAASLMEEDPRAAYHHLMNVTGNLGQIRKNGRGERTLYMDRVHGEIDRLFAALERDVHIRVSEYYRAKKK